MRVVRLLQCQGKRYILIRAITSVMCSIKLFSVDKFATLLLQKNFPILNCLGYLKFFSSKSETVIYLEPPSKPNVHFDPYEVSKPLVPSIEKTIKIFKCSPKEAKLIVKQNENVQLKSPEEALSVLHFVNKGLGFPMEIIKKNMWLLNFSKHELKNRFELLQKWDFRDPFAALPLFGVPMPTLMGLTSRVQFDKVFLGKRNRITFFADVLKCGEEAACKRLLMHKNLLRMKLSTLQETLQLLIDSGVLPEHLLSDLWILAYHPDKLKVHILKAKMQNIEVIKPWMLRCSEKTFQKMCTRDIENRTALGDHENQSEYLQDRLIISPKEMERFKKKHPLVMHVQSSKLKESIDYLYSEGFTPEQIKAAPRVLCHSISTVKERLSTLRDLHYEPFFLTTLCRNKKSFDELVQKLKLKISLTRANTASQPAN